MERRQEWQEKSGWRTQVQGLARGRKKTNHPERLEIKNEDGHTWRVSGGKQRELTAEYCPENQEERLFA